MSTHDDTYHTLLRHVLANGDGHDDRTGVGTTSVFGYQCRYPLAYGFPLLTTKRMAWRSIVVELAWFLLGRTDNQWLTDRGVTIWNEWSTAEQCAKFHRPPGDLGPVYGHQWRNFGGGTDEGYYRSSPDGLYGSTSTPGMHERGTDQIKALCNELAENPTSRRLIVTGWNPAEATRVALPPCHTLFQCKVRTLRLKDTSSPDHGARYLDLQLYQRSADSFLGVPFNIASYALLVHLLAHTHGMRPGVFIHAFGDLHIYNNHREQVQTQLGRSPLLPPVVRLPERLGGRGFAGVLQWAEDVGAAALDPARKFAGGPPLTDEPVMLCDYVSHPSIKAPVAV